jgi:hypothetical protein
MPIAPQGQSCLDPATSYPNAPIGNISLTRSTTIGATTSTTDSGEADFGPFPPVSGNPFFLPAGTCIGDIIVRVLEIAPIQLDAGPAITITGPNGSQQLPASAFYSAKLGGGSGANAQPLYLTAGAYTVSGPGGTEVGPFSQNFTIPQPLTWTNQGDITTVDRSAGLDITWTGGDPNGTVQITGDFVSFLCDAKISDQHFTIPAFVLLSLPPSSGTSTDLMLSATSTTAFTASGISSGSINSMVTIVKTVTYR